MGMLSADDFLPFKTVFEQSDIFLQLDQIRAKAGEVLAGGDKKAEGGGTRGMDFMRRLSLHVQKTLKNEEDENARTAVRIKAVASYGALRQHYPELGDMCLKKIMSLVADQENTPDKTILVREMLNAFAVNAPSNTDMAAAQLTLMGKLQRDVLSHKLLAAKALAAITQPHMDQLEIAELAGIWVQKIGKPNNDQIKQNLLTILGAIQEKQPALKEEIDPLRVQLSKKVLFDKFVSPREKELLTVSPAGNVVGIGENRKHGDGGGYKKRIVRLRDLFDRV